MRRAQETRDRDLMRLAAAPVPLVPAAMDTDTRPCVRRPGRVLRAACWCTLEPTRMVYAPSRMYYDNESRAGDPVSE